ncbi:hypothetical protein F5148DRAFT_1228794 [Russula earlei]|uniref:Uncharacterized protein n=1 Tax=Russula earlei TaxID=71964 RepID=A0ACC0U0J8_9AGAM|nr:hypothetical protein F5148DRAFT_1228794 [Russula earlei]
MDKTIVTLLCCVLRYHRFIRISGARAPSRTPWRRVPVPSSSREDKEVKLEGQTAGVGSCREGLLPQERFFRPWLLLLLLPLGTHPQPRTTLPRAELHLLNPWTLTRATQILYDVPQCIPVGGARLARCDPKGRGDGLRDIPDDFALLEGVSGDERPRDLPLHDEIDRLASPVFWTQRRHDVRRETTRVPEVQGEFLGHRDAAGKAPYARADLPPRKIGSCGGVHGGGDENEFKARAYKENETRIEEGPVKRQRKMWVGGQTTRRVFIGRVGRRGQESRIALRPPRAGPTMPYRGESKRQRRSLCKR